MTDKVEPFPVLYILMRSDLTSLNCGKIAAQASHASNAFEKEMTHYRFQLGRGKMDDAELEKMRPTIGLADHWKSETTQGFGTVLVLAVNETEMKAAVDVAEKIGLIAGVVHDPTYPLVDGDFVHVLPLDTCAYIFMDKNDPIGQTIVRNFPLHP